MANFYIHFEANEFDQQHVQNFGDAVNRRFWEEFTLNEISVDRDKPHYITTGSIMAFCTEKSIIYGTGFISAHDTIGSEWNKYKPEVTPMDVIAVRGPLSRQKLLDKGIECPKVYGDPLIMFPAIYGPSFNKPKEKTVGILPHYHWMDTDSKNVKLLEKDLLEEGDLLTNLLLHPEPGVRFP